MKRGATLRQGYLCFCAGCIAARGAARLREANRFLAQSRAFIEKRIGREIENISIAERRERDERRRQHKNEMAKLRALGVPRHLLVQP
jgi:hypothetical protein